MRDIHLKQETVYQLRKSLIPLNRAFRSASKAGDVNTCKELKKCLNVISKQIKVLSETKK